MGAVLHAVVSRHKAVEQYYAEPGDFGRGSSEPVDGRRVVDEPGWAPYCVDADRRELVFAHTPPEVDLAAAPFHHVAQYRNADALITMPLDEAAALAETLPLPEVALIFSIGRCGTTLISHALNGSPDVESLSEPGVIDHRPLRALVGSLDVPALIGGLCRLLFAARQRRGAKMLAIKFRSQGLFIADLFRTALPAARHVFMYRDAIGWGESFYQFLIDIGVPMPISEADRDRHWMMISADAPHEELARYCDLAARPVVTEAVLAAGWPYHLEAYMRLLEDGMPFLAVRYNELVRDRDGELRRIFDHCGISHDGIAEALTAFDEDSQKGTTIARKGEKPRFDEAARSRYLAALAKHPGFADSDLILPDIYSRKVQAPGGR